MPSPCHFHRGKLQHSEGSCRRSFPLKYFPCPVRANEVPPVVPRQDFVLRFSVGWAPRSVTNAISAKRVSCHLGCLPPCHGCAGQITLKLLRTRRVSSAGSRSCEG